MLHNRYPELQNHGVRMPDLNNLERLWNQILGDFDTLARKTSNMKPNGPFPPHNVIYYPESGDYKIEMAVAGFSRDEIDVHIDDDILKISGKKKTDETKCDAEHKYLHRGIAQRDFILTFSLRTSEMEVTDVCLENGILKLEISRLNKDSENIRHIPIREA